MDDGARELLLVEVDCEVDCGVDGDEVDDEAVFEEKKFIFDF